MKILLTGRPGSGKTTLLEEFIERVPHRQGFVAREVREDGQRMGFELVSPANEKVMLASVSSTSDIRVSRYGVEVAQLDTFLHNLPPINPGNLLYVDEIGQMELYSDAFTQLVTDYLEADNDYVGTITSVYQDDFTKRVLKRDDILVLTVEAANRKQVKVVLDSLAENLELIKKLSPKA